MIWNWSLTLPTVLRAMSATVGGDLKADPVVAVSGESHQQVAGPASYIEHRASPH